MNRVNKIVTKSKDEFDIFRTLAFQIQEVAEKTDVMLIFDVLCAKVPPSRAMHLLPENLADVARTTNTNTGKKQNTGSLGGEGKEPLECFVRHSLKGD